MTPFDVLQWIGVVFVGMVLLALGIVAVKAAFKGNVTKKEDK